MPLHDWTDRSGWKGVHHLWITELYRWVKSRLPEGYRAYIGTAPTLAVGAGKPDVSVIRSNGKPAPATDEPDLEVAVAVIDPGTSLFIEQSGRLIATLDLVSPRNKDRLAARSTYLTRYVGYLMEGVNLLLMDVHLRPAGFSFFDGIGSELSLPGANPALPAAVNYRVGDPAATGGRFVAVWQRPFEVGAVLPTIPLALSAADAMTIALEVTYARAAADAYLD